MATRYIEYEFRGTYMWGDAPSNIHVLDNSSDFR